MKRALLTEVDDANEKHFAEIKTAIDKIEYTIKKLEEEKSEKGAANAKAAED